MAELGFVDDQVGTGAAVPGSWEGMLWTAGNG
jgi:hypothetical protein